MTISCILKLSKTHSDTWVFKYIWTWTVVLLSFPGFCVFRCHNLKNGFIIVNFVQCNIAFRIVFRLALSMFHTVCRHIDLCPQQHYIGHVTPRAQCLKIFIRLKFILPFLCSECALLSGDLPHGDVKSLDILGLALCPF